MRCLNCMQDTQGAGAFCPHCGRPLKDSWQQAGHTAYLRPDYDPFREGRFPQGQPAGPREKGPPLTGTVLLALFNMLGFGFGISFLSGLTALVFALLAAGESQAQHAQKQAERARLFNLIGLVFLLLQLLVLVALAAWFLLLRRSTAGLDFPLS